MESKIFIKRTWHGIEEGLLVRWWTISQIVPRAGFTLFFFGSDGFLNQPLHKKGFRWCKTYSSQQIFFYYFILYFILHIIKSCVMCKQALQLLFVRMTHSPLLILCMFICSFPLNFFVVVVTTFHHQRFLSLSFFLIPGCCISFI